MRIHVLTWMDESSGARHAEHFRSKAARARRRSALLREWKASGDEPSFSSENWFFDAHTIDVTPTHSGICRALDIHCNI